MDRLSSLGAILVQCSGKCGWEFWVDCIDSRLPDRPLLCSECDVSDEACALAEKRLAQDLLPIGEG